VANQANENNHDRNESTSEVKGKFTEILSLINNAINGKMFYQDSEIHEIYLDNELHGTFLSIFIKREEIDRQRFTTVSVKQGLIKNKVVKNILTFKDLRKVYISISPGSDVVFLFTDNNRYTVLNVFKDTNIDVVHGIDRRTDGEHEMTKNESSRDFYDQSNEKRRQDLSKRRIFISL